MPLTVEVEVPPRDREVLASWVRSPSIRAGLAQRARIVGDPEVDVTSLAYDSRKAGPGTLFFCVVGEKRDGHEFAAQVVEAGAAVRTRRVDDLPGALEGVLTDPRRRERMVAAARRLGRPDAAGEAASMIARLIELRKEVVA